MKKAVTRLGVIALVLVWAGLALIGCGSSVSNDLVPDKALTSPVKAEVEPEINPVVASQAEAYYLVFRKLLQTPAELSDNIRYIALDLSGMMPEPREAFIRLAEDFCAAAGITLLLDDMDGLREKEYITNGRFTSGVLICFQDITLTEDALSTRANRFHSNLGGVGSTFTVFKRDGTWEVMPLRGMIIS